MERDEIKRRLRAVGANMKRHRRGQRIAQQAVADKVGGSQSRISRWEAGASSPRIEDFLVYADAINARPELLLAGVVNESIEQLQTELDVEAGEYVVNLVQLLHRRRLARVDKIDEVDKTA